MVHELNLNNWATDIEVFLYKISIDLVNKYAFSFVKRLRNR